MSDEQAVTEPGATSRRALLVGAGAAGAAVVLSACGGDEPEAGTSAPTSAPTSAEAEPEPTDDGGDSGLEVVGPVGDVPVGGGALFPASQMVVTQPTEGEFRGFRSVCTHQGCPIAGVDSGTINCTCHGSKFSLEDGTPRNGPATRPLATRDVRVEGDNIVLA
jgi:Rieske Fe-S protein